MDDIAFLFHDRWPLFLIASSSKARLLVLYFSFQNRLILSSWCKWHFTHFDFIIFTFQLFPLQFVNFKTIIIKFLQFFGKFFFKYQKIILKKFETKKWIKNFNLKTETKGFLKLSKMKLMKINNCNIYIFVKISDKNVLSEAIFLLKKSFVSFVTGKLFEHFSIEVHWFIFQILKS